MPTLITVSSQQSLSSYKFHPNFTMFQAALSYVNNYVTLHPGDLATQRPGPGCTVHLSFRYHQGDVAQMVERSLSM